MVSADRRKVAIIGAGHNGLVCAAYLAGSGCRVDVYERRDRAGGMCVTESLIGGFKISSLASYFGMLRQEIVDELDLESHGLSPYLSDPVEIVLLDGGNYVYVPREGSGSQMSVGDLGAGALEGWQRFWAEIGLSARLIYPYYLRPETRKCDIIAALDAAGLAHLARSLFDGSLVELLKNYVDNRHLAAVAATCTPGFASDRGSVFGCIHHGTARTCGEDGAWGQVRGGMGAVSEALLAVCRSRGVAVRTGSPVAGIAVRNGRASGLLFANGGREDYDIVISNADPRTTLKGLLPEESLPGQVYAWLESFEPRVSAAKIHFALSALPHFPLLEAIGHNYKGVIVIAPPVESVIADSRAVAAGLMPERLMLTMAFPSLTDDTVAPSGSHLLTVDVHYLPAAPCGRPWGDADTAELVERTVAAIEEHSPGFRRVVAAVAAVTPREIATVYGVESASCWHRPMSEGNLFEERHLPGCPPYATPIEGLYLCGAGTYPGGNVTGAPGRNCAFVVKSSLIERI